MRIFLICLLTLVALFPEVINGQSTLPFWVPEEALLAAKRQWEINIKDSKLTSLRHEFGLNSISDALSCELRNPYRVIRIDYERYKNDCNLYDCLSSSWGTVDSAYGFGIYYHDNVVGHISVAHRNGSWTFLELSGYGSTLRGDLYAPIYNKYPIALGYVIYREDWSTIFFVLKDRNVIGAFIIPDFINGYYHAIEPREYLREEKTRIMKAKYLREERARKSNGEGS